MLTIDFIGLIMTIALTGLRYPHYVLAAAFLHDAGMILTTLFFNGQLESVITAGAFSLITVSKLDVLKTGIIAFSGPLVNYAVCALTGGIEFEKTADVFSPAAKLKHPMAVINFRMALISLAATLWFLIWK